LTKFSQKLAKLVELLTLEKSKTIPHLFFWVKKEKTFESKILGNFPKNLEKLVELLTLEKPNKNPLFIFKREKH
jgi:hypothetical protein